MYSSKQKTYVASGFTLVELVIVIAILSILLTITLAAINPLEQFAKARDAGRIAAVNGLSKAVLGYETRVSTNLPPSSTWISDLSANGDLNGTIRYPDNPNITSSSACATNNQNGYCYNASGNNLIIYTKLESKSTLHSVCGASETPSSIVWAIWSSADGRQGYYCGTTADPTPQQFGGLLF